MSPFRVALRWALTLLATGLVILALLTSGLRLAVHQVDTLRDELNAQLARQFNATLRVERLDGSLWGFDPSLEIDDLQLIAQAGVDPFPLLEIERARLRLDTSASLRAGYPVFDDARAVNATLHLYQDRHGRWKWPEPAQLPPELVPDSEFQIEGIDYLVGVLLRQQAVVDELRVDLHGVDDSVTLVAPRLLMAGDGQRAHLEGRMFIEGERDSALQAALEVLPGQSGLSDFDASLQARADLDVLSRLGRLLTQPAPLQIDRLSGEAELWGYWRDGRLEDARAKLDIVELTMAGDGDPLTLRDVGARAQWLRGERDDWRAWINALPTADIQDQTRPLPQHLVLDGDNRGWRLRSTSFDIAALADWGQRLPLSATFDRAFTTLAPSGRVAGLEFGWREGSWRGRAALRNVSVSPWDGVPGGGPLDAWVEAKDGQGSVRFVGLSDMTLAFPEVFAAPLALDRASGEVDWSLSDETLTLSGQDLGVAWRGATVTGGFRFVSPIGAAPGELELNLDMADVDAIKTPLMEWLPSEVLDPELRDWLAGGIAGRVPHGSLYLKQALDDEAGEVDETSTENGGGDEESFDGELRLALRIEEGHLPYDPEWPALENVSGELQLDGERLHATVEHAETLGLVSEGAEVALENERLAVRAPVQGPTQALLDFLAVSPVEGMDAFADWHGEGRIAGRLALNAPMDETDAFEVDVQASVDAPSLTFSQVDLTLGNVNGDLHYRHADNEDFLTGTLGARAFDGPLLASFDVGGEGISFEGRALARGLLDWAGIGELDGLLDGYFPYSARLDLEGEEPRLTLDSDLEGLAIRLPAPFGKDLDEAVALHVDAAPGQRLRVELADRLRLRWRALGAEEGQGQVWLERWPTSPQWPAGPGWEFVWRTPRLDLERWRTALADLQWPEGGGDAVPAGGGGGAVAASLRRIALDTDCLEWQRRCLGSLQASGYPLAGGQDGWRFDLAGSLAEGQAEYRPGQPRPLAITLSRLHLDTLLADAQQPTELASEIATAPEPVPLPAGLNQWPEGRVQIDSITHQGRRFGPLAAGWDITPQRLSVTPLSLTLGEVEATGELVWESSGPRASLTRSRIALAGGDLGTLFEALDQPVALRSESTDVLTQLAWPGAPWQFALERSRGSIEAQLGDGRFLTLDSPSARLIGLLNVDNLLRRLRLDFTDVTGQGTAFDSVTGDATLYGGRLETRGPVEIDGPSTQFSLDGSVDLAARRLDLLLGVTVPVSQNLPLAAVLAGAPYVGGALFLADKVFGGWIDKVTRIHYRVRGPWTSPQITLEEAE